MLTSIAASAADSDFPLDDSMRPAVNFWKKVYTQSDTEHGFLHDSFNLDVVYEKLPRDTDIIDTRRKAIIADLNVLASGKRQGLSETQRNILNLWGESTSNQRFTQATENVRWQLGQSDRYRAGLVRSGAYRSHIENVVTSMGMPKELAALPHVESSFHPGAYSSAAASGMWQFIRGTARRFMRVDNLVDERLDPYQSSYGAMNLLQENYRELGKWPLALTAYNYGTTGMKRAVKEMGTSDIAVIVRGYKGPRFGFASRNFYAQFVAALEVEKEAEQHFGQISFDQPPQFEQAEMTGYIDAAVLARSLGISVAALKNDNPALLSAIWSGQKRIPSGYTVKVNRAVFSGNMSRAINTIAASDFHTVQIPDVSYIVSSGDSLSGIASRFRTTVSALVAINQLPNRNSIRVGQTLVLPQQDGQVPTVIVNQEAPAAPLNGKYAIRRGDTLSTIAARFNTNTRTLMQLNNLKTGDLVFPGQQLLLPQQLQIASAVVVSGKYKVRSGDSLFTIAQQFKTTAQQLLALNELKDGNLIFPGQELIVRQVASGP